MSSHYEKIGALGDERVKSKITELNVGSDPQTLKGVNGFNQYTIDLCNQLKESRIEWGSFKLWSTRASTPEGWRWANSTDVANHPEQSRKVYGSGTKRYWVALADHTKMGGEGYGFAVKPILKDDTFLNKLLMHEGAGKWDNFKIHNYNQPIPWGWQWVSSTIAKEYPKQVRAIFRQGTKWYTVACSDDYKMGGPGYGYTFTKKQHGESFIYMLLMEESFLAVKMEKKGFFDETNNFCYAYLREKGNDWWYDPDKVHPKIVDRIHKRFDTFDLDGNATLELDEIKLWPERMRILCNATDAQVDRMKDAIEKFFICHGVDPVHGCKRENYLENNRVFAEFEREKIRQGEMPVIHLLAESYFDVLDADGNGYLTYPELQTMMAAFEVPIEAADSFFAVCDENGDGKLEYEEMHTQFVKFWFSEYEPKIDHIFAHKY